MRGARRGVVYVAILIVCIVLLIGVFVYNAMMRQGRMAAYRSLDIQYAQSLARAGATLAQGALAKALHDPASALRTKLVEPLDSLKATSGGAIEIATVDLVRDFPDVADELMRDLPGGRASLKSLTAHFTIPTSQLWPLPDLPLAADRKLARGGREKMGRLMLECTATLASGGLMGGVSQTVTAYQEFRVVEAPVPVLSDFTLWVKDIPNGADESSPLNKLEAAKEGLLDASPPTVPLVLSNGKTELQEFVSRDLDVNLLMDLGWVYLGGSPVLNLTYSQDEPLNNDRSAGEDFHFYQQDPSDPENGRAVKDPVLSTKANEHLSGKQFWQVRTWDMGVNTLKDGPLHDQYEPIFDRTPPGRRLGSILKLFGVAPDRVSPTVVFGHVLAGYFRISAVVPADENQADFDAFYTILKDHGGGLGAFLAFLLTEIQPYASKLLYVFDPFLSGKYVYMNPDDPSTILPPGSGASQDAYNVICAGFKTRAYNVGLLHLKARNVVPDPTNKIQALGLPAGLFSDSPDAPEPNQLLAALLPAAWASLDRLDLSKVDLEGMASALDAACCWKSKPADHDVDTLRGLLMLRGDTLDLGSTVSIAGKLELPALTSVDRGGVIVADEITVDGAIPAPAKGVLVLVARTGNIKFPGGQTPVNASLIALKGSLVAAAPPKLTGNLVGGKLDLGVLTGGGALPATLTYDHKLKEKALPDAPPGESLVIDFSRRFVRVD